MNRFTAAVKRFRGNSDGATAVEFALVSLCFFSMLIFIYVAGIYFITFNALQFGTEDAARYASIHEDATDEDLRDIVEDRFSLIPINVNELDVVLVDSSSNGVDFKEVQTTYRLQLDIPMLPPETTDVTFSSTSKMAIY